MPRKEVSELYECKACGGLVASTGGACPYCNETHVGTKTVKTMDGGTKTVKKSWYRRIEIVPERTR